MADDASASAEDVQLTFNVKAASDKKLVITMPASSTVADLKAKLATPEYADVPAERQRLIYSGRVLKDPDTLASAKIKDGNTIHLVKGAASNARQNPASQASGSTAAGAATPQVPTNIATGTGRDPLAGLTGARYAGFHGLPGADMFGPDGGMGPPPDAQQMLELMENPMFASQFNEAMNNPAVIEMISNSPMIRDNPMLQNMIRDPHMRRILFNPQMMRMQMEMQRAMNRSGERMTAPGVTDTTPQPTTNTEGNAPSTTTSAQQNTPGAAAQQNPFAALLGGGAPTGTQGATPQPNLGFGNLFGTPSTGAEGQQQPNPIAEMTRQLMQDPEAMRAAMNMFGQMPAGAAFGMPPPTQNPGAGTTGTTSPPPNPFASLFGPGALGAGGFASPPPQDNRPPEEVYEVQLRQLNEMGFYEFDRNVAALRRSGGNVQGAIEHLLNGGS
ncbi:uncharacterized protein EI97DRAFT_424292 [Westerdykella ornata]|uniref:Ubiquitin-domain-containing protein n=1 Tax=Westerdykella ornata TaxID=318751 RepID=A0A6A6JAU8_WESOR|nr:uncharacterized protein EI97DRAFT_424292 [Westerdykella ornata]KAF2273387.1 hypothetical protein EI97DRAFT_424292 [Westerdykella ornata]